MNVVSRIVVKWCALGILIGGVIGLSAYFVIGGEALKEPPSWALMILTVLSAVPAAVREAYAAGARSGGRLAEDKHAEPGEK